MRISCPACSATYEVPDSRIGTGRKLRCARCGHDWWVAPSVPAPAVGSPVVLETAASPAREEAPPAPRPEPPAAMDLVLPVAELPPVEAPAPPPRRAEPPRRPAPPPAAPPVAPPVAPLSIAPPLSPPVPAPPPDRSGGLMLAWLASLLVFCGVGAGLFLYRAEIVAAWPPAERLYVALGLGPPGAP